jgi:hypothetical protein
MTDAEEEKSDVGNVVSMVTISNLNPLPNKAGGGVVDREGSVYVAAGEVFVYNLPVNSVTLD